MTRKSIALATVACAAAALGAWKMAPPRDPVLEAMDVMIQEEYHTAAQYERIARDHAGAQPYAGWAETERAHAELIGWLYHDRGKTAPPSRWTADAVPTRRPLPQACASALAAEERAVRLYDGYLEGELPSDVRRAFRHNRNVSYLQHLPVLRECTLRGTPGR
ncbi:MAG TPA: hypothetical protein VFJ82_06555 [Longimicrobium sp.]|nr:hypothetical protein [Longimicrobium sp.]